MTTSIEESLTKITDSWLSNLAENANKFVVTDTYSRLAGMALHQVLSLKKYTGIDLPGIIDQTAQPLLESQLNLLRLGLSQARMMNTLMDPLDLWHSRDQLADIARRLDTFTRVLTTKAIIAQTPRELIWSHGKAKLYRYCSSTPKEHKTPLLLVFAIMNRPSILDLMPGRSYVEYMLSQGYDLYLLDWGRADQAECNHGLDDYALQYLPGAIQAVKTNSQVDQVSILGWCLGALISTIYAASRPDDGLKNLVLLTAPLDFSDPDLTFRRWLNPDHFDVDELLDSYGGMMPASYISNGAAALKPIDNQIGTYTTLWKKLDDKNFVDFWHSLDTWKSDNVSLAGRAYRQVVVNMYRENQLTQGKFMVEGSPLQLSNVKTNLLAVIADQDHITPPPQTELAFPLFGSADKTVLKVNGGHIGLMIGGSAKKVTWPSIDKWLAARS